MKVILDTEAGTIQVGEGSVLLLAELTRLGKPLRRISPTPRQPYREEPVQKLRELPSSPCDEFQESATNLCVCGYQDDAHWLPGDEPTLPREEPEPGCGGCPCPLHLHECHACDLSPSWGIR